MKKYLIPESGKFFKANLHCHSTFSDGSLTPEELKEVYKRNGYSIIAFTDHDVFIPHQELRDDDFLPLNGFEAEINEPKNSWLEAKSFHACFIALDPDNLIHPFWHRSNYLFNGGEKYKDLVLFDENEPDYIREYSHKGINDMMRIGREKGFFVTYNHPIWSLHNYSDYIDYENMNAMEIYNHGCYVIGYNDYVPNIYDDILKSGKKIYCLAADDNHNHSEYGSPTWDSCGGFVMIKAEKLEYKLITDAIVNGNFYSSRGPIINSIWYDTEQETINLTCEGAAKVTCNSALRLARAKYPYDYKVDKLSEVSFKINPNDVYVRLTVFDENGLTAETNAYFIEDLKKL